MKVKKYKPEFVLDYLYKNRKKYNKYFQKFRGSREKYHNNCDDICLSLLRHTYTMEIGRAGHVTTLPRDHVVVYCLLPHIRYDYSIQTPTP